MAAAPDDPVRAEVERVLHLLVAATVTTPLTIAAAVPRCLARRASALRDRLGEPARVARSVLDLVGAGPVRGVLAPDDAPSPDEPATPLVDPDAVGAADAASDAGPGAAVPSDDHLPIDEYESLAASQVVARLPTLRRDELEAVRAFEAGHRGRRTILGKIDQLLA
jgi:hypothetical protein